MARGHTTFSSYMPAGFHDQPLPLGKYYPTNYEQRNDNLKSQRNFVSESVAGYSRNDMHGATYPREIDKRKRLEQYQRDMVAQAAMALHSSRKTDIVLPGKPSLKGLPLADVRLGLASPHNPSAPRLIPLGSPGPVTPMELEAVGGAAGGYLDKGKRAQRFGKENLALPDAGFQPRSL